MYGALIEPINSGAARFNGSSGARVGQPQSKTSSSRLLARMIQSRGERITTYSVHAANESDALAKAEAFFSAHPEHDCRPEAVTSRVGQLVQSDGRFRIRWPDGTFDTA